MSPRIRSANHATPASRRDSGSGSHPGVVHAGDQFGVLVVRDPADLDVQPLWLVSKRGTGVLAMPP
jgi:hypothetical protein